MKALDSLQPALEHRARLAIAVLVARHGAISFAAFKEAFVKSAVGNFGSGWTWLVKKADGSLDIVNTTGAGTPASLATCTP